MSWPATKWEESSPAGAGAGGLEVCVVSGLSAVTSVHARSPLKLLVPRPRGAAVWAYVSSFGGGLVAGDQTRLSVKIKEGARCFLTTQASTKVYRNPSGRPTSHLLRAELAAGSMLVLAPDPVQAFAEASYAQSQQFYIQANSGLVVVDWFGSGRVARGERWAFTGFRSRNEIFVGEERLLLDSLLLDPADGPLEGPHRLGRYNCLALILIVGAPLRQATANLLEEDAARPLTRRAALLCGASPLQDGILLRFAGECSEDVASEVRRCLRFLPELLGDDPWARKW